MVVTDFGATDTVNAQAVQPDGKLVAAGQTGTDVVVTRYGTGSVASTSTTSTTVASLFGFVRPVPAQLRSVFAASPFLSPFLSIIDNLRGGFRCP